MMALWSVRRNGGRGDQRRMPKRDRATERARDIEVATMEKKSRTEI